jgi:hypothetical protein
MVPTDWTPSRVAPTARREALGRFTTNAPSLAARAPNTHADEAIRHAARRVLAVSAAAYLDHGKPNHRQCRPGAGRPDDPVSWLTC